jgi:glycogen debranching enzyme
VGRDGVSDPSSHAGAAPDAVDRSPAAERERRERVLTQGKPSVTRGIAEAVVIKDGNLFFLSEPDARVPLDRRHGLGLYHHDCRFLNGYELWLAGTFPNLLISSGAEGYRAIFEFSNPDIPLGDGRVIPAQEVGIAWERIVDGSRLALHDRISFRNYGLQAIDFPATLAFRAEFEDVFVVRGLLSERPGEIRPPAWHDGMLRFRYDGADGVHRSTTVAFSPHPDRTEAAMAHFQLHLGPGEERALLVSLCVAESAAPEEVERPRRAAPDLGRLGRALRRGADRASTRRTTVRSDSLLLNRVLERSFRDLHMLRSRREGWSYFSAGLPWFGTLFGRDTIITALETLAYSPDVAAETLRVLAAHQGTETNGWRDEEPGKILHELRVGEYARMGEIPHTPYYGTVDATPLFLVLLGRYTAWTGDLELFHELKGTVERALEWMRSAARPEDGYIAYRSGSKKGLVNQGWKDSGDAIVNADGSLAEPPIALVEVQGYVYLAKQLVAELYRRAGAAGRAERLEREAAVLREGFNRDFWMEQEGIYALARQAGGRQAAVVSSNPGHALWAGIADREKARRTAEQLMAADMFSGWGVRTLSSREKRYNPIGYHLGTVWPHDNAILAAGLRRYGFDRDALRVFSGVVRAVMDFEHYRLPELFAGFGEDEFPAPVRYPVACHPQAWAAGSIPYLLETLLGLVPEAFEHRLRIVRPLLPDFVDRLRIDGLRVGSARVGLRFERTRAGVSVQVLDRTGDLDVVVEPASAGVSGTA